MDVKALFKKGIEKELLDVDDYIFTPQRFDMMIDEGELICVLNSDGSVNVFYSKHHHQSIYCTLQHKIS